MRCEFAREQVSAAFDGEVMLRDAVEEHVASCGACVAWRDQIGALRRELRFAAVDEGPDVAPAVLERLSASRRPAPWAGVAAAFVAAVMAGAAFVGLRPDAPASVAAADVPDLVLEAQHLVERFSADLTVIEHGWHPQVPVREFSGRLTFSAPESLTVVLDDETDYPSPEWLPHDVVVAVTPERWWGRGQVGCPQSAQPGCAAPPRARLIQGREPFERRDPAPLDLVVPVGSFRHADAPAGLGSRRLYDREAVGMAVDVAQVDPLLDGLRQVGDWRGLHPTDRVELWLDAAALVPLELTVRAARGDDRSLWAARNGYTEDAGDLLLEVRFGDMEINGPPAGPPPDPPEDASVRDAGFRTGDTGSITVGWLPEGMELYRTGQVTTTDGPVVDVAAWTDGRAWVKIRATSDWRADRLFGGLGGAVRPLMLGDGGTGYAGEDGSIALHTEDLDVVVTGSVDAAVLEQVAAGLPIVGQPMPPGWRDAAPASVAEAARAHEGLVVADVDGFDEPAVRLREDAADLVYVGPGSRRFVLSQSAGSALAPPLEPDVRGIAVRGTSGRYTPSLGELEWVEGGRVVSLRSDTLALGELLGVAEGLTRP